jgi:aryl-phospho-beta-D-glucosidase BglC (GH1 family)
MPFSRRRFVSGCIAARAALPNALALTKAPETPFVRVHKKNLIAPGGEKIMLRGINLGNWFEPEGYMFLFDGGPQSPREIEAFFNELIGPSAAKNFWTTYRRTYISKPDIDFIRSTGLNSVRIPLHYKFFLESDEGFAVLDPVVDSCRQVGLWVILDLHCAPGGQTGANIDDSWGYPWLYESAAEQEATVEVWKRIAHHYRDEPTVLGYDLLNEPDPQFPGTPNYIPRLASIYRQIIAGIRQVDSNHIIILGGARWDTDFSLFDSRFDPKTIYTFHTYGTPPEEVSVQAYVNYRDDNNVPLWLGESGENTDQWIQQFVRVLEQNHVGWCFWPYKKVEKSSCMVSIKKPAFWDEILAFVKVPAGTSNAAARVAARPSLEHSRAALESLLENIRFENCRVNSGYVAALGGIVPAVGPKS